MTAPDPDGEITDAIGRVSFETARDVVAWTGLDEEAGE